MPGSDPLYYWDTCLFLAWLKDEERSRGEMDGVRETIARQRRREVRIMTSVVTSVEVLSAKIPVGMDRLFADLLKRISRVGVDSRVATVAHDLRNHYAQKGGKTVSTTDATSSRDGHPLPRGRISYIRPSAQRVVHFAHQRCGLLPCVRSAGQRVDLLDHPLNAFL